MQRRHRVVQGSSTVGIHRYSGTSSASSTNCLLLCYKIKISQLSLHFGLSKKREWACCTSSGPEQSDEKTPAVFSSQKCQESCKLTQLVISHRSTVQQYTNIADGQTVSLAVSQSVIHSASYSPPRYLVPHHGTMLQPSWTHSLKLQFLCCAVYGNCQAFIL